MTPREETAIVAAHRAIRHVLSRTREDDAIAYYLGVFTQSFDLLVKADHALCIARNFTGVPDDVNELEKQWLPRAAKSPLDIVKEQAEMAGKCPVCERECHAEEEAAALFIADMEGSELVDGPRALVEEFASDALAGSARFAPKERLLLPSTTPIAWI